MSSFYMVDLFASATDATSEASFPKFSYILSANSEVRMRDSDCVLRTQKNNGRVLQKEHILDTKKEQEVVGIFCEEICYTSF